MAVRPAPASAGIRPWRADAAALGREGQARRDPAAPEPADPARPTCLDAHERESMVVDQQIKVTLVRSVIGNTERQRASARSLGLTRLNKSVVVPDRPEIRGMIRTIEHLVRVESVAPAQEPAKAPAPGAQSAPEAGAA